jgi:hypothetical protein
MPDTLGKKRLLLPQPMAFLLRSYLYTGCVVSLLLVISSCSFLETTPVSIPAYVYVPYLRDSTLNNQVVNGTIVNQGDSSNKYVDVWIYNNGKLLGNIGFPALIPVQSSGVSELEFDAGILKSGQDDTRIPYPFNARQVFYRSLQPNRIDTFYPVMQYLSNTRFSFIEGFESNGFQFNYNAYNNKGDTVRKILSSITYDSTSKIRSISLGKYCGSIQIADSSSRFEMNSDWYNLADLQPATGAPVYLEIDYKSDMPIEIGMYVKDANGDASIKPQFTTNPTGVWNKVYICLDQDISPATPGSTFSIAVAINKGSGVHTQYIYIDNIKLVHF